MRIAPSPADGRSPSRIEVGTFRSVRPRRMTSMRGGVLRVTVPSSTVGYELDRLLREGLLADLRSRFRGTLSRVVVRVGDITAEDR